MKFILIVTLFFCLATGAVIQEPQRQASQSDDIDKRATNVLSNTSCQYLKSKGYLENIPSLNKLCLGVDCKDLLSQRCCNIVKTNNDCKKDSSLSLKYCRSTCNRCEQCKKGPLGMESGAIPDSSITASSVYSSSYPPSSGRLNHKVPGYGWAAKPKAVGQWIQVDLREVTQVTGVATQGRNLNGEWVTSYSLQYSDDGKTFTDYQTGKIFKGNSDYNTIVKHDLVPPITARYIRLLPKTWYSHITLRMELYGCK